MEFRAGRINGDLWKTADDFERLVSRFGRLRFGTIGPKHVAPDQPIGVEFTADGVFISRYLAYRMGALFDVLIAATVEDARMEDLAGESFPGQSVGSRELTLRGRTRVIDALRLASAALDDFGRMASGQTPRSHYGLGPVTDDAPAWVAEAANDNARQSGNAGVKRGVFRTFRTNERAVSAEIAKMHGTA